MAKASRSFHIVYDGQGNLVRSIDFICQKEYTYTYDAGGNILTANVTGTVCWNGTEQAIASGETVVDLV